jgi:hypothetical protein
LWCRNRFYREGPEITGGFVDCLDDSEHCGGITLVQVVKDALKVVNGFGRPTKRRSVALFNEDGPCLYSDRRPRVQFELTRYLSDNWVPVIEKDVDVPQRTPAAS